MRVKVKFFAVLRERLGKPELTVEMEEGGTVQALWESLRRKHPKLPSSDIKLLYAVNRQYVGADHVLKDQDEVVFVPPVSGG